MTTYCAMSIPPRPRPPPPMIEGRRIRLHFWHLQEPPSPLSTYAELGDDEETEEEYWNEARDMEDIQDWLLGEERGLPLTTPPPPPAPPKTYSDPPFDIFATPAPLILQIIFSILTFFRLATFRSRMPTPPMRRDIVKPYPLEWDDEDLLEELRIQGTRGPSLLYQHRQEMRVDDTEYIIKGRPGTDEETIRIPVTRDISIEKLKSHSKRMARIYRVPHERKGAFARYSIAHGLKGMCVRLPDDDYDNIAVMRHGIQSWDFGEKDERWFLMSTDKDIVERLIARTAKWPPPPLHIQVRNRVCKAVRKFFGYNSEPLYYDPPPAERPTMYILPTSILSHLKWTEY
ncbi:hypothetical protein D9613_004941 [Agrocybe pediades]|uniref:Uncharacterized protein n=1 Tax=Agrocybe pediades TaxID=84607 RepID=A0A8H4VQZ0_9AGAR|nr:hypothetical protein D9613_004941 [Agrocybe pediades]